MQVAVFPAQILRDHVLMSRCCPTFLLTLKGWYQTLLYVLCQANDAMPLVYRTRGTIVSALSVRRGHPTPRDNKGCDNSCLTVWRRSLALEQVCGKLLITVLRSKFVRAVTRAARHHNHISTHTTTNQCHYIERRESIAIISANRGTGAELSLRECNIALAAIQVSMRTHEVAHMVGCSQRSSTHIQSYSQLVSASCGMDHENRACGQLRMSPGVISSQLLLDSDRAGQSRSTRRAPHL